MDTSKEIEALLEVAKEGDMIEFIRDMYSHWGIYMGKLIILLFFFRILFIRESI